MNDETAAPVIRGSRFFYAAAEIISLNTLSSRYTNIYAIYAHILIIKFPRLSLYQIKK